jgi:hypothetical protein
LDGFIFVFVLLFSLSPSQTHVFTGFIGCFITEFFTGVYINTTQKTRKRLHFLHTHSILSMAGCKVVHIIFSYSCSRCIT